MERKYHPILKDPHHHDIVFFSYFQDENGISASYIEIHLSYNGKVTKLKFRGPVDLEIEKGFPVAAGGMFIEDISDRQLDGLNLYVGDFESSRGSITFWANDVTVIE